MICNNDIHDELILMNQNICPFCDQLLVYGNNESDKCCLDSQIEDVDGIKICLKCGLVNGITFKPDYFDFYNNMYKIVRKSVYIQKYHIENILNDLSVNKNVVLTCKERDKIYQIFTRIKDILHKVNKNRKRIISVKYILKQIFDMMDIKCHINITKSKKTLAFYNKYWMQIMALIGDKIEAIIVK